MSVYWYDTREYVPPHKPSLLIHHDNTHLSHNPTYISNSPTAALVSSARKSKADVEMEEGGKALGGPAAGSISRTNTLGTFDDTATASSMDNGTDGTSSVAGSSVDDAGEAFEKRSHVLFPGQYAEFDGLDPLSI